MNIPTCEELWTEEGFEVVEETIDAPANYGYYVSKVFLRIEDSTYWMARYIVNLTCDFNELEDGTACIFQVEKKETRVFSWWPVEKNMLDKQATHQPYREAAVMPTEKDFTVDLKETLAINKQATQDPFIAWSMDTGATGSGRIGDVINLPRVPVDKGVAFLPEDAKAIAHNQTAVVSACKRALYAEMLIMELVEALQYEKDPNNTTVRSVDVLGEMGTLARQISASRRA